MNEVQATYEVKTEPIITDMVYCQGCDVAIGSYIQVDSQVWIEISGLHLYVAHGKCALCDMGWHFVGSDKKLERLLQRIKDRPKLTGNK